MLKVFLYVFETTTANRTVIKSIKYYKIVAFIGKSAGKFERAGNAIC
jgi:hypothetical protein